MFISTQTVTWTLADLCRVLGVSRSGYYQWQAASSLPVPSWQPAAQQAFTRHAGAMAPAACELSCRTKATR